MAIARRRELCAATAPGGPSGTGGPLTEGPSSWRSLGRAQLDGSGPTGEQVAREVRVGGAEFVANRSAGFEVPPTGTGSSEQVAREVRYRGDRVVATRSVGEDSAADAALRRPCGAGGPLLRGRVRGNRSAWGVVRRTPDPGRASGTGGPSAGPSVPNARWVSHRTRLNGRPWPTGAGRPRRNPGGLVTYPQARDHLSHKTTESRLRTGRLVLVRWGVYRHAGAPVTRSAAAPGCAPGRGPGRGRLVLFGGRDLAAARDRRRRARADRAVAGAGPAAGRAVPPEPDIARPPRHGPAGPTGDDARPDPGRPVRPRRAAAARSDGRRRAPPAPARSGRPARGVRRARLSGPAAAHGAAGGARGSAPGISPGGQPGGARCAADPGGGRARGAGAAVPGRR